MQLSSILARGRRVVSRTSSARRLKTGDTVNIPANAKHWHGAAPDSWFQHIALEVPGTEQSNEWCEPVDNAAYAEATSR